MKFIRNQIGWLGLVCLFSTNSYALGPVDGEIGVVWWANDFDADFSDAEIDAGSLFVYGEGWFGEKWGIRGAWYDSDVEGDLRSDLNRLNVELRRKIFSSTDNNFLALGIGGEDIEIENGESAQGIRLSAEARLGIPGPVFFYGKYAWVPDLGSAGNYDDLSSSEIDLGVHITPFPFMSVRVGYLDYGLDYKNTDIGRNGNSNSSGFYLGAGFHW